MSEQRSFNERFRERFGGEVLSDNPRFAPSHPTLPDVDPMPITGKGIDRLMAHYGVPRCAPGDAAPTPDPVGQEQQLQQAAAALAPVLARLPKELRTAFSQAKARLREVSGLVATTAAELEVKRGDRPRDLTRLPKWSIDTAAVEHRHKALLESQAEAQATVDRLRGEIVAALIADAYSQERSGVADYQRAAAAVQRAQATVLEVHRENERRRKWVATVRDQGLNHAPLARAVEEL